VQQRSRQCVTFNNAKVVCDEDCNGGDCGGGNDSGGVIEVMMYGCVALHFVP